MPKREIDAEQLYIDARAADFSTRAGGERFAEYVRTHWDAASVFWFKFVGRRRILDALTSAEAAEAERITDNLYNEALAFIYSGAGRKYLGLCLRGSIPYVRRNGELHDLTPAERVMRMTLAELAEERKPRNANPKKQKAVTIPQAAEAVGLSPRQYARLEKTPDNAWGIVPMARETCRGFQMWLDCKDTRAAIRQHKVGGRVRDRKPKTIASPDLIDNATRDESGRVTLHRDGKVRTHGKRNR